MQIKYLRVLGYLEGASLLVLLFIAMPAKYLAGELGLVRHVGSIHGLLFLAFGFTLASSRSILNWPVSRVILGIALSSVPFGTFWFDKRYLASGGQEKSK